MDSETRLSILNPRPEKLNGPTLLHDLVSSPSAFVALEHVSGEQITSLSYTDLHNEAEALAARISSLCGPRPEQMIIPVLLHQSPHLYITLLGILKAGAAFCPLNLDAPTERVKFILSDVQARVIICTTDLAANIPPGTGAQVLCIDTDYDHACISVETQRVPTPNDLAYVMYTSGSTGTPKGVGLSHHATTQALLAHDRHIPAFSRFLQFAAPTFDVSVFEIFFPLFRGRTLISARRHELLDDLPSVLNRMDVDACELTPTVAASLLRTRASVPKLKLLLTIGEMLNARVIEEFGGDDSKDSILWAMYGPTEATIHCTLQSSFRSSSSTRNIGVPLDTVSCYIIEPESDPIQTTGFKLLPRGETGELAVGGEQLATEYLNNAEKTHSVFIQSPFGRIYRTGDRARISEEGTIECFGRLTDGQVKLRGQRIELGEVEHAALRVNGCHGAVASIMGSILVLFAAVDATISEEDILESCRQWLPRFMNPGDLFLVNEFPRLPSGKTDIKSLKALFQQRTAISRSHSISSDEQHSELLRLVSSHLGEQVHPQTKLSSVGVDSLAAIELSSFLRSVGHKTDTLTILRMRTFGDLIETVSENTALDTTCHADTSLLGTLGHVLTEKTVVRQDGRAVHDVLPCTPLQVAMLGESARDPEAYWNCFELEFGTSYQPQEILEMITTICQHNEILRTGFVHHETTFYAVIFEDLHRESISCQTQPVKSAELEILQPLRVQIEQCEDSKLKHATFKAHHAIYDGWSMDLLITDLSRLLAGQRLTPRPQFREFVSFHSSAARNGYDENAKIFWDEQLFGWSKPPIPKLAARPGPPGHIASMALRSQLQAKQLVQLSSENEVSPQVYFQAALALVWGGVLGVSDVVLGSVTSGRTLPIDNIENIMGPCIASMPLRVNLGAVHSVTELVNSIALNNRKILQHSSLSLLDMKKLIGLRASEQLYDVLFVYQDSPDQRRRTQSSVAEIRHMDRLETPLVVEVQPKGDGFTFQVTYHSEHCSAKFAQLLLQQVDAIVGAIIEEPCQAIQVLNSSVSLSLSTYNLESTSALGESSQTDLATLFEMTASACPDEYAISFAQSLRTPRLMLQNVTYRQLNQQANQMANLLISRKVLPGEVVAIVLPKSPQLYVAILGTIKARCAYLPLLPSTPASRIAEVFRQSQPSLSLTDTDTLPKLPKSEEVICIDRTPLEGYSETNIPIEPDVSRLAYVIYTSGTTGVPKGVAVTQENIVSNITYLGSVYPVASKIPKLLQACSQAFDVSVFEIFYAWHKGMCLCTAPKDVLFEDIEQAIRVFEITHLSLTPTVASLVNPKNVPTVEFLVTAGEPMTQAVHQSWGAKLWQGYGPSETTNICSIKRMNCGQDFIEHLGWIFPNTSLAVLFPESTVTAPAGWVGEFCFGGKQVAQGYLNMPQLTSEKFIDHPLYGRIYRSGDMGRVLPDGSLIILGRIDDQVKLRGQRIETAEVNSVVTSTALATSSVTIIVRLEGRPSDQLATFFVAKNADETFCVLDVDAETIGNLFAELFGRLPTYMVPSYLIPVSCIPMTSSGKIDKKLLQGSISKLTPDALEKATYGTHKDDVDEWSDLEKSILSSVCKSLCAPEESVRRWTPFTVFGLDSISAIQVSRDLGQDIHIAVSVSALLQHPTVAQIAQLVTMQSKQPNASAEQKYFDDSFLEDIKTSFLKKSQSIVSILPCTPLQEAMISRGKHSYYNKVLLRIRVLPEQMRSYWGTMTKRHSILRTCFISTNSSRYPIAQVALNSWNIPWQEFDVTQPSLDEAIDLHLKSVPEPIDTMLPPLSLALIRYRGSCFLSFICHHALYDGIAMECLWREVETLAKPDTLSPEVSYEPFLHEALDLPGDTQKFWSQQFRGFQPTTLFELGVKQNISQITHTTSLSGSLERFQQQLRSLGVSLLSVCQTTWAKVLNVLSLSDDVCFGNVMNGRTVGIDGIGQLVAPCFNTVPIRQVLNQNLQNIELARSLQKLNVEILRYQFTPLRLVQKLVPNLRRSLFDTLLLVQQPLQEMDESIWTLEQDSGNMDIPLVCEIIPCPSLDSLVINLHHDMSAVSTNLSAGIGELFKYLMLEILSSPHSNTNRNSIPVFLMDGVSEFALPRVKLPRLGQEDRSNNGLPWADEEEDVREVLSTLSCVSKSSISKSMSIFHLGLDSINAVQVASMLRQKGYVISSSEVVECQTARRIGARILENLRKSKTTEKWYDFDTFQKEVLQQIDVRSGMPLLVYPCTPVQSAMLAAFISSKGKNYMNLLSFKMRSDLDPLSVSESWLSVAEKHPMLRTGFSPVRHPHASFAMLQYESASSFDKTMSIIDSNDFNKAFWKTNETRRILENLHMPAWRVGIVLSNGDLMMHVLIHHALYDAQSLNTILCSVDEALNGNNANIAANILPGLSSMMLNSISNHDDAVAFWETKADNTVVNSFPVMTPLRENTRLIRAQEKTSVLSFPELQNATKKLGVSVQAAIQAAWCRVLASYLGEAAVTFGVTLSGRTDEHTIQSPMPCLITLPVIARSQNSNKEQLEEMMQYVAKMHKYQHLPLASVQKSLGYPGTSVFDTLLVYQRVNRQTSSKCWSQIDDDATVEYPVSLEIEPQPDDSILLRMTHFDDVLPQEQVSLLLGQFDLALEHLVLRPESSENEMHLARPEFFAISPPESPNITAPVKFLHEFVEQRAKSDTNKTALEYVQSFEHGKATCSTWTFGQLDELGNRAANMLQTHAPANSIIAIHFEKCPEAYFSILGILKSGSSFVALDSNAPNARKEFILRDSNAPCLLTDASTVIDFDVPCPVIRIDKATLQEFSSAKLTVDALTPGSTCYCLYTSGTTGTPKGCEITHENTVQCMMAFQDLFKGHWQEDSRWLQFAALHFDVSVLEQYWSWSVGMTVVAAKKDMILDDLLGFINTLQITHIDLTPSLARLTHPDTVPTLCKGIFITGGEQLKQEILDAWGSKAVIYNAYGPTEATIGVTTYKRVPQNGRPSNIGQQFKNVGSYVFRPGTEIPVLRGGVGELCVSGKLVGKGYLNRPELTDEKFPTLKVFGERIYRTGDLVRLLHDGCFEFLGRADDQVKLRGQRLEIGEIDHVIRSLHCIHDGATIVTKHASSGKDVLVAFVVGEGSNDEPLCVLLDPKGLGTEARAACREKLPGYMVPSYYLRLPFIPLSSNNKAEAKALKALFAGLSQDQLTKFSANTAQTLRSVDGRQFQKLLEAVSEFCAVPASSVSLSTSIFDIGIDSIVALQLSSFLKQNGFTAASPALVLRNPVLADMSAALSTSKMDTLPSIKRAKQIISAAAHKHRAAACQALAIVGDGIDSIHPCSPLQQGIIAKALIDEERGTYFNSFQMVLKENTSLDRLKQSWEMLKSESSVLRSAFVNTRDGYMQVVLRQPPLQWKDVEISKSDSMEAILRSYWNDWVIANHDTIAEPLQILRVDNGKTRRLVIHIFHGVYDGTSFNLILRNIERLYQGEEIISGPQFSEALANGPLLDHTASRASWEKHLKRCSYSPLNLGSETDNNEGAATSATAIVDAKSIEEIGQQNSVTSQSVLLALWTATLQKYSAAALTIGVIISGRTIDLAGVQNTIGPLFNTLPFFSGNLLSQTWPSLLRRCEDFNSLILEDPHVPLQNIQKWCSHGRHLFNNLFTYMIEDNKNGKEVPWQIEHVLSTAGYPLALEITRLTSGQMRLFLAAEASGTNQDLLEQILDEFRANITSLQVGGGLPITLVDPAHTSEAGVESPPADIDFEWTPAMLTVRQELANLATVPETDVTAASSIFELGLDSIDVIQLSSRLRGKDIIIQASQLMKAQTVGGIAEKLAFASDKDRVSDVESTLGMIQAQLTDNLAKDGTDLSAVDSVLPPTPLQEAMVSAMIQSDFTWYFNHNILEINDGIDVSNLKTAWLKVIAKSPILRTGFVEVTDPSLDMSYAQLVHRTIESPFVTVELATTEELSVVIDEATRKARDSQGRSNLVQLAFAAVGSKNFMVISISHALYDGWSLSLIHQDLCKAYQGDIQPRPSPYSFLGHSIETKSTAAANFWANYLNGAQPTLSADKYKADEQVFRKTKKSQIRASELDEFCKRQNISMQALLQACWASILAHRTQSLDVNFGVVLSGRDFEGADELMFPTMNTVAVRCILHGTVSSLLRYIDGNLADIREYQSFPLRKARAVGKIKGELFDSLFVLQKSPRSDDGQQLFKSADGYSAVDYPICVEAEVAEEDLTWTVACHRQVGSKLLADHLATQLDEVLQYLTSHESEDAVQFGDQEVSVAGLPATTLPQDQEAAIEPPPSASTWTEPALLIRAVLSTVSNVPEHEIQISSTLYHLGLDSITAIKVSSLLKRKSLILKPTELVRAASISEMALIADRAPTVQPRIKTDNTKAWKPPASMDMEAILRRGGVSLQDIDIVLPATSMQVHMTSVWQNTSGKVFYPDFWYHLPEGCTAANVEAAWQLTIQHHTMLRTCLITTGDEDVPMIQAVLKNTSTLLFDATRKPLAQLTTHKDSNGSKMLRLHIHHALYDGISLPVIAESLSMAIQNQQLVATEDISLWVNYASGLYTPGTQSSNREFWTAYLQGVPRTDKPDTISASTSRTSLLQRGAIQDAKFPEMAAKRGISIQAIAFAAFARSIQKDGTVVFGIYLANRANHPDIPSSFPTLNLVPLKVNLHEKQSLAALADQIQDDIQRISSDGNLDVGLWEIYSWTGVQIAHFVNFLSLPDTDNEGMLKPCCGPEEQNTITPRDAALDDPSFANNAVRHAYPASMDIEMSTQNGDLDIGVFGPSSLVSADGAQDLIQRITTYLED